MRFLLIALLFISTSLLCSDWTVMDKVRASDGDDNDKFGISVSVDGDYALIGSSEDEDQGSNTGSAYIFVRNGSIWTEQQKLIASDASANDWFGYSVSISGNTALIGAYNDNGGSAYIFNGNGTIWTEHTKLTVTDGQRFGWAVSIDGDYAVISDKWDNDNGNGSGSAYIYYYNGSIWSEQAKLVASDGDSADRFGYSVFIEGDYTVIGAYQDGDYGEYSGSAYIFHRNGDVWTEQAKLTASDGDAYDYFGYSVSISGNNAIIGAHQDSDNGEHSGSAYIFHRIGDVWTEQAKLTASDGASYDVFGYSVSISESYALIGATWDDDNGGSSGSVYIFIQTDIGWIEQNKLIASDGSGGDFFGCSVSLTENFALIGAEGEGFLNNDLGAAYFFLGNVISDFYSNSSHSYLGNEITFYDNSIGNPTNWFWDFQNDGIYDSFDQDPIYTYTEVGNFDVKLKITNDTLADSLIKHNYITVEYVPPASPTDVQVNISGDDAVITWTEVDTTIFGDLIDIDYYIVLFSEDTLEDSLFYYHGFTADTTYTHYGVALHRDQMFYRVESFVGTRFELDNYIDLHLRKSENNYMILK